MLIFKVLKTILSHPLNKGQKINTLIRFFKWQLNTRLNPYPIIFPYAEKSKFIISKGMTGATGNLYCGLHEFEDMGFVLHFLRESDSFIDIGANVGSYTLLGASEVGAETLAIEPIPITYRTLTENIFINKIENKVKALNIGLGDKKGQLNFTSGLDTMNHVAEKNDKNTIEVPVERFDDLVILKNPSLVKIDVEGFETEVLKGMKKALQNENFKALIIELNGAGTRYGYDESLIHKKLLDHGFKPFKYNPFDRLLKSLESYGTHNTIYIKDIEFVNNRLRGARKFKVHQKEF